MLAFKNFIVENLHVFKKYKTHLEHAEDLPIDYGEHGYHHAIEALSNVHKKLQGRFNETKIKPKYDGSPAVIFGHNPENGRFFVGTKSVFSAEPKINYTPEDINRNHGDAPGLADKLKTALEHLPKVAPKHGVYQGDYMYGKDDVFTHNGEHNFTPNTIQYSTPEKSEEGKKITKAKMGITVHTKYHGHKIGELEPDLSPDTSKFRQHPDVHMIPDEVSEVLHTGANQKDFEHHIKAVENVHSAAHPDIFKDIHPHIAHIKTYINQTVRNNVKPSLSGYREHLMKEGEKNVTACKTPRGKQQSHLDMLGKLHHVEYHAKQFESLFKIHYHIQKAKNALINSLSQGLPYEHSINGEETKPEGFVVVHKGHPIKLVDRSEFSRANFNKKRD